MTAPGDRGFDAVIVGAGVTGAVRAALLAARRLSVPGHSTRLPFESVPTKWNDSDLAAMTLSVAYTRS